MKQLLKRFEVENFKGFSEPLIFDLSARDYGFNKHLVNNGIVNKAIVYGKNGIGKTSLGIAVLDIISHLTDKEQFPALYVQLYQNLNHLDKPVRFQYCFRFANDEIEYEYEKMNRNYLLCEKLTVNGKIMLNYDYFDTRNNYIAPEIQGNLQIELVDNKLSVLKYIYRNTPTNAFPPLTKMMQFCENMLWYRSLSEGNAYAGFTNGINFLEESLYQSGKIHEFESFLRKNGIDYTLKFESVNGQHQLMVVYQNGTVTAPFMSLASTGTKTLLLFFYWSISSFSKISFLFIDEFDAFFHYESAELIVQLLNEATSFQSVLTSHNTYLMQNKLTRPDCCFLMTENKISSLYHATEREIREAHNLEKMYINGAFTEI